MLDRRAFNKAMAALGLGLATQMTLPQSARAAGGVSYFTWAGYEVPELHKSYIQKYGASPEISFFGDEEEGLQKIRAGFLPSLAHPCSSSVARWRDAGVLEAIDVSRLKNWADVLEPLKRIPGTTDGDRTIWIPFDWGSNSIVYRSDLVDPKYTAENSWMLLWDERYKGRLAMWTSVDGAVAMAAAILGIKDTANVTDEQFKSIKDLLVRQKDLLRFYWDSETVAEEALASGEVVASYLWSASAHRLRENGVQVEYMLRPKEGIVSFLCGLVRVKGGGGDEQEVYDFIDDMISPESGTFLVEQYGYGHSNRKAHELVSDEALKAQGLTRDVSGYIATTSFFQSWPPDIRERYIRMFDEVKASL
jgi:spermidine/putrescine-binding protein